LLSLGPEVLLAAANGTMDPETAEMLLDLDETDRIAALSLFNAVNPGANKRRQIITLLKEISLREDKSVAEILGEEAVSAIWRNSELNRQVREQRVRDYLFNRRYPLLSRARQEQKRIIRDLNLPPNFQIQPSPNFEGLDFRLEFSFAGQAELDRAGKTIEVLSGLPAMLKLLELG